MSIKIFTDGGSRGNPGPAAIGAVAYSDEGGKLFEISQKIGVATNNQAEYRAVVAALERLQKEFYSSTRPAKRDGGEVTIQHVQFFLDSELLVKQFNQEYKIKDEKLKDLFWQVRSLVLKLGGRVSFQFVSREENREADRLVNRALDK